MKLTFKGGIHPYEGKELTMDKDVIEYVPKGDMVYPLSQHIGAPAKAVVKKGDRVLVGQLIAEAGGFVSANIHSSVSGTVKAVEPRLTASGSKVNSIVIENDNQFEEIEYVKMRSHLRSLQRKRFWKQSRTQALSAWVAPDSRRMSSSHRRMQTRLITLS